MERGIQKQARLTTEIEIQKGAKMACSATPSPSKGGPKAARQGRKRSRCKLGFGNKAAIVRSREPTPKRPSLDLWKSGLGPSARDHPTSEGAVVIGSLPTARRRTSPRRSTAGLCRGRTADLASSPKGLRRRQPRNPSKGSATSKGVHAVLKQKTQKSKHKPGALRGRGAPLGRGTCNSHATVMQQSCNSHATVHATVRKCCKTQSSV